MHRFTLPSGIDIELREMTGAEEEILTNQRLIKSGEAINRVLQNCITKLGDEEKVSQDMVLDLLSGDRLFALVKLRQISLGDEVELESICSNAGCRMTNYLTVNLEELEVTPYPEEREFTFQLPGSGQSVRFCYLDGHIEWRNSPQAGLDGDNIFDSEEVMPPASDSRVTQVNEASTSP